MPAVFFTDNRDEIATTLPPSTLGFIIERGKPRSIPQGRHVVALRLFDEAPPLLFDERGERLAGPRAPRDMSDPNISAASRAAVRAWEARRDEHARGAGGVLHAAVMRAPSPRAGDGPPAGNYSVHIVATERATIVQTAGTRTLARLDEPSPDVRAGDLLAAWVGGVFRLAWVASL